MRICVPPLPTHTHTQIHTHTHTCTHTHTLSGIQDPSLASCSQWSTYTCVWGQQSYACPPKDDGILVNCVLGQNNAGKSLESFTNSKYSFCPFYQSYLPLFPKRGHCPSTPLLASTRRVRVAVLVVLSDLWQRPLVAKRRITVTEART